LVTDATTVLACPDHATLRHAGSAALRSSRTSMSGDCHGLLGEAGHGRIDGSGLPSVP
jgi:hypothetical protein